MKVLRTPDQAFRKLIPSAQGMEHNTIENAGHFLQEDKGEELADHLVRFVNNN